MNTAMSSRERVVNALHRQPVDRIPIDYLANSGIDARLKRYFNLSAADDEGLLRLLNVDFRELRLPYHGKVLHKAIAGRMVDPEWGIVTRWVEHESGGYWDYCDFPLSSLDAGQIANWPLPDADDYDYASLQEQASRWPGLALYFGNPGLGDMLNTTGMWCSMESVFIALAEENEAWLQLVDRRMDIQLQMTERSLEALRGRLDFIWMGEDLGSQIGPLISKEMYRNIIRPRHQRFLDLAAAYGVPVMMHSCGSSSWAFDDFIEMGIAAVDTLQPEAAMMDPVYLKKAYGGRLAFHGGFSTAGPVVDAPVDEVIASLRALLSVMMDGGGYLFSPTHLWQDNSNVENVAAVYRLLPELGRYR